MSVSSGEGAQEFWPTPESVPSLRLFLEMSKVLGRSATSLRCLSTRRAVLNIQFTLSFVSATRRAHFLATGQILGSSDLS